MKTGEDKHNEAVYTAKHTGYVVDQYVALYVLPALQPSLGTIQRSASEISTPKEQAVVAEDLFPFTACSVLVIATNHRLTL